MLNAHILSIGTEILMGELVDTNAPYIASQLPDIGINLISISQVDDKSDSIIAALSLAIKTCDVVFTTGGLGPTADDVTRESIANLFGEIPYVDEDLTNKLATRYGTSSPDTLEGTLKQATLIPSAVPIPNLHGTAPGWWVEKHDKLIIAMPGPPSEMKPMWESEVMPKLKKLNPNDLSITRSLRTFGIGESTINQTIAHLFHSVNIDLGIYAQNPGVDIRIRATANDRPAAIKIITQVESEIRDTLGTFIWGVDDQNAEGILGHHMTKLGLTLATMESCTGGLLAHTITQVPGSSRYFRGGNVSYSNQSKIDIGVSPDMIAKYGSISPEVAKDMSECIRVSMATDIGIGITGVAGPDTMEGKAAGTIHIGISINGSSTSSTFYYKGSRDSIKKLATMQSLLDLNRLLADKYDTFDVGPKSL